MCSSDLSDGYDRATIRAVASAAGVDAGLVMHYFGSKQELYRRVIDAAPVPELSGTPAEAAEQILAGIASRLESEPAASLALLRSMLTNPEAASAASDGIARYQAQIAQAIPAGDADLRAAIITAITLGIMVSRHLVKSGELATADPAQVVALLRPCVLSLAARPAGGRRAALQRDHLHARPAAAGGEPRPEVRVQSRRRGAVAVVPPHRRRVDAGHHGRRGRGARPAAQLTAGLAGEAMVTGAGGEREHAGP